MTPGHFIGFLSISNLENWPENQVGLEVNIGSLGQVFKISFMEKVS